MVPLDRVMAAIHGSCQHPPVVIPYLQYYFGEMVDQMTPYSRDDFLDGELALKVDALSIMHEYIDCDWIRAIIDPPWSRDPRPSGAPTTAEQLLEEGIFDLTMELVKRFGQQKFVYGRVGIPYGALFADWSDISGAMIMLKTEPDRCKQIMEDAIPQRLEEIKAWAQTGVHAVWLGQWMCSADMISEADYLNFVYPYDKIIVEAVRAANLIPLYHFCGDAIPRMKHIKTMDPVVVGVEESKKGFKVDVGDVRAELGDEICILGNVDVYDVVELGSPETWEAEIERQIRTAGPERFIVSCGSPITHDTPPERVQEFVQVAKRVRDNL